MKKIAWLIFAALVLSLPACQTPSKKPREKAQAHERNMPDAGGDVSYQAFVGRLRLAVASHDATLLASMMTPNFGYSLEPLREGEGVFKYWDDNGLWPELQAIVNETFASKGDFMVAPPQFATDPNYRGYRAGLTRVGGSWKFAYFVSG
jgi:hypothetical protein